MDEPVNETADTKGFLHISFPTGPALSREHVTTFNTPAGIPAFSANWNMNKSIWFVSEWFPAYIETSWIENTNDEHKYGQKAAWCYVINGGQ
jgi:hypothetical protein